MSIDELSDWQLSWMMLKLVGTVLLFLPFQLMMLPLVFMSPDFAMGMSDFTTRLKRQIVAVYDEMDYRARERKKDVD